jgi:hypothetical protein
MIAITLYLLLLLLLLLLFTYPLYHLGAIHKIRHTNFMIVLPPPLSLSQVVTFLRPLPIVTSHILQCIK